MTEAVTELIIAGAIILSFIVLAELIWQPYNRRHIDRPLPTDPAAQAQVLGSRLLDPDLAAIGRRGRILARTQFSWPVIGLQLGAAYQWLAREGPRPDCVGLD